MIAHSGAYQALIGEHAPLHREAAYVIDKANSGGDVKAGRDLNSRSECGITSRKAQSDHGPEEKSDGGLRSEYPNRMPDLLDQPDAQA